jgi:hypothetical protein
MTLRTKARASIFGKARCGGCDLAKHRLRDRRREPRIHPPGHHSEKVQPILISGESPHDCAEAKSLPSPDRHGDGKQAFATLSKLRNIDSKRLVKKIVHLGAYPNRQKETGQPHLQLAATSGRLPRNASAQLNVLPR